MTTEGQHAEKLNPTEAICDEARWFILARDAGITTWSGLLPSIPSRPTIPYIEEQIAKNPSGHITKWDVADCVYQLMATAAFATETMPSTVSFQSRVKPWMDASFGPAISADKVERNHRFLEEALEPRSAHIKHAVVKELVSGSQC
jgi:hypothetical protein